MVESTDERGRDPTGKQSGTSGGLTLDEVLNRWIPYRLQAVETLKFAWDLMSESSAPRQMEVLVEGKVRMRGNVAAVANPMIEAGFIHARALLEFLGLGVVKGRLARARRKPGDIAIEHYSVLGSPLSMVAPEVALSAYPGPREDAENALVAVFELANKSMAHLTNGVLAGEYGEDHLEIAWSGIPVLVNNGLYAKLGREIPPPPSNASKWG